MSPLAAYRSPAAWKKLTRTLAWAAAAYASLLSSVPKAQADYATAELEVLLRTELGQAAARLAGISPEWQIAAVAPTIATERALTALRLLESSGPRVLEPTPELIESLRGLRFDPGTTQSHAANAEQFGSTLQNFENQWINVQRVRPGTTLAQQFTSPDRVVVQIGRQGDFNLFVGNRVLMGAPLAMSLSTNAELDVPLEQGGAWVDFGELPAESMAALRTRLAHGPESVALSCVNADCLALKRAGITLAGDEGQVPVFRLPALRRMIQRGAFGTGGERLELQIHLHDETALPDFLRSMEHLDTLTARGVRIKVRGNQIDLQAARHQADREMEPETRDRFYALIQNGFRISAVLFVVGQSARTLGRTHPLSAVQAND